MDTKIGNIYFTKKMFVEAIGEIKKQQEHDRKCSKVFGVILPNDFISLYDNSRITNKLFEILKVAFNDNHRDSWIEYYIWELDFGKEYKEGSCTNADGSNIDISNAGKLYDFLMTK